MAEIREVTTLGDRMINLKLALDASEAITGLKTIQREAREATRVLRELEEAQKAVKDVD